VSGGASMRKALSSTLEDYLEAIFRLQRTKRAARVRDIASHVGVTKSSVTAALRSLDGKRLLEYKPYGPIVLTPKGRERALGIVRNHCIISQFLRDVLALPRAKAERVACELEHAVDRQVVDRLVCFLAFAEKSAAEGPDLPNEFRRFLNEGSKGQSCRQLIAQYQQRITAQVQ
jgi:DtxR family Mn-dependent transcriptional regulator